MKKTLFCLFLISPCLALAQIGIKAGLNFANVTNASSIDNSGNTGFNVGIFYSTSPKKILGSKTELVFSRQGYDYQTNGYSGKVSLDYIMLPQYLCISITRFFQVQVGMQVAYLLNAKSDSTQNPLSGTQYAQYGKLLDYYNRFDYGLGAGIEVHPYMGLLVGARANFSLNNLYKNPSSFSSGTQPSFIPTVNVKNYLLQIYLGWRLGH